MTEKRHEGEKQIDELVLLSQGKLKPSRRKALEKQIAEDKGLRALYNFIRVALETREEALTFEAVSASDKLSLKLFQDFQKRKLEPALKRAVTTFDSSVMPLPEGVRPAAVDTRALRFQLPRGLVELALYPISVESYDLVGMISEYDAHGPFEIRVKSGRQKLTLHSDAVNLFRIPRISRGKHVFTILSGEELVGTIDLEL